MAESGIYVYGVSRDLPAKAMSDVHGVSDAPVRTIEQDGLTAVVSPVGLDEFGEAALRRNLEDLAWLETTARAHHAVVDEAASRAATIPLGLATVYRSEERVRQALRERGEEFTRALNRIIGRSEWGVKVYADLKRAETAAPEEPSTGRPGTSYLRRRLVQRNTEEEGRRAVLAVAEQLDAELREIAVTRRLHRPQDSQLSGERGWMVLNAAYLVDDERVDDFRTALAHAAELRPDLRLQLTGPWAPYSFAAEEEAS